MPGGRKKPVSVSQMQVPDVVRKGQMRPEKPAPTQLRVQALQTPVPPSGNVSLA